ncbi:hypothetical protein [Paraflavitalea speifideaquila]|uniref:hypothetical protein n=1 Tax=Paraflavitalea speifideaquila TaxID=3076558 RepID=UPI0028EEF61F|nr:hypothetical protein [Paraflavitalea speifideiaquila]
MADKLQNLPPPGEVDQSWEQMRTLLDKEMPRGGGMPGRRQWWLLGIAIGVLFMATWLSGRSFLDKEKADSVAQTTNGTGSFNDKPTIPAAKLPSSSTPSPMAAVDGSAATGTGSNSNDKPATAANSASSSQPTTLPPDNKDAPVAAVPADNKSNHKNSISNNEPKADEAIITHKDNRTVKFKTAIKNKNKGDQAASSFRNNKGITNENKTGSKANNEPGLQTAVNTGNRINSYPGMLPNC